MSSLLAASMWLAMTALAQSPTNDDCANAIEPLACQPITYDPNLGVCSVSAGPPNIMEVCDMTVGSAPRHDCVNPAATCQHLPPGCSETFRCQFITDNRLATTDGPNTSGTQCSSSGLNAFQSDVWYTFIAPCSGYLTIQNCADSDYDSLIQVFSNGTATCPSCPITGNALNQGCNDDHCSVASGGSALQVSANKDSCLTIRVGGANSPTGQGMSTLDIGFVAACDGCIGVVTTPVPAPTPHDRRKNRYISFAPNNEGSTRAFRVRKTTSPGGSCWVQTPVQTGPDQYTAKCDVSPVFRVWNEPVIHVGDCEITPVANYEIYVNALGPLGIVENPFPLAIGTILLPTMNNKLWGDTVGVNNGTEWTPPNQFTNVNDVLGILAFIAGATIRPHFTVANLQAISAADPCLNPLVNTSDILISVQAIAGGSYGPPSTAKIIDPALCPVCP